MIPGKHEGVGITVAIPCRLAGDSDAIDSDAGVTQVDDNAVVLVPVILTLVYELPVPPPT